MPNEELLGVVTVACLGQVAMWEALGGQVTVAACVSLEGRPLALR